MADSSNEFKIDNSIPIPPSAKRHKRYPFDKLEIGQSFFVPNTHTHKMTAAARHWARKLDKQFTCRMEGNGVRVWRIR